MKIEIDVDKYLYDGEKKEIAQRVFEQMCRAKFEKDIERIFSNSVYYTVQKIVEDQWGTDFELLVKEQTIKAINELSSYTVFKPADAWDRDCSKGWTTMQETIENNKHLIKERFEDIVKTFNPRLLEDFELDMDYEIKQLLMERLFGEKWAGVYK